MFSLRIRSLFTGMPNIFKNIAGANVFSTSGPDDPGTPQYLPTGKNNSIAYRYQQGTESTKPGIIFCPGFQSNMLGVKANAIGKYCKDKNLAFVRFDYEGCGESEGDIHEVTMSDWKRDVMAVLDQLTAGPQIIIGSSMGAWLMLMVAMERPHRLHSLIGIATAADFPQRGYSKYPQEVRNSLEKDGIAVYESDHHTYVITQKFLEDAKKHDMKDIDAIPITCPVRLLHGMQDQTVHYDVSLQVAQQLWSRDVSVFLHKSSDHRFSQPEDIQLIFETLDYLIYGADEARNLAVKSWSSFSVYSHHSLESAAS